MKKRLFLVLGLLCGIVLPLSTQAYEDGIYTGVDENGNEVKTVIFGGNDSFSGVKLTIKMRNQTGYYYWGFNENTDNSVFDDYTNPGTGKYMSGDGKMHGGTYGEIRNNLWGGGADTYENGFNPNPTNLTGRQGPCDSGYHVPSRGERNALAIAWCNLDENCNARYSDTQSGGVTGDLIKLKGDYAWTPDNKLISINGTKNLGFMNEFNTSAYSFWSSSPSPDATHGAGVLSVDARKINPNDGGNRGSWGYRVRCLRNSIIEPTVTISFLDDGIEIASGRVLVGDVRSGTEPIPAAKTGYYFDYRYADGEPDTEFEFDTPMMTDTILRAHWTFMANIPNGIYTGLDNGEITVIWNDDTWGSINMTIAGSDLFGRYYRGFKYPTSSASGVWDNTTSTYGVNNHNARGGIEDDELNGYSPNPINYEERQGPCPAGYHVPSRGEWNNLLMAWCSLDDSCNVGNLQEIETMNIIGTGLGTYFWAMLNIDFNTCSWGGCKFWSSSPWKESYGLYSNKGARYLTVKSNEISSNTAEGRSSANFVRCFKNYITVPQVFTITFFNDGEYVWSGDIVSGKKVSSSVIAGYLTGFTKDGYTFSGWIISGIDTVFDVENDIVTTGMTLNAVWNVNQYTITFKDGDNEITSITADYGTGITPPDNPTKNGYTFKGWDKPVPSTMPAEDMIISAKWERNGSSGGGGGGGGGGGSSKTDTGSASSQTGNQINSNTGDTASTGTNIKEPETNTGSSIQTGSQVDSNTGSIVSSGTNVNNPDTDTPGDSTAPSQNDKTYSTEFQQAYEFAKGNGITTMPTIQKANMEGKLTRIAMAKMLSQYAINVLGKTPDTTQNNKFNDVTDKLDSDYDDGVTLAYQLGIMGQNMPGNNFRPNDEVTRAEFATALSRMAYGTLDGEYKATSKYYVHHMEKLVKEGIITNDDPNMKELRGYVMIMLMRSAK